ncbi:MULTISPECIES: GGDEF domain-containing protein [Sphingomonas]|uniref:GGDEF domain-containing protein n=1 Tax=Sphingomonas TaxID=13687 RepID=UPI000F7EF88E|nr:diguanylate cyclase [Sphingomonas sp. ABOLF]RSV13760.1 diguanylate cyclase [Sphingomonas sp. ABOLF]GLK20542.1 hypothetical protein GCM10017606_13680 [Microbacterium terregens]
MMRHLPIGRLAERLEAWPAWQAWLTIIAAAAALASVDHANPGIGMGPLYVPLICAAGWSLGERQAYLVAVAAAILSISSYLGGYGDQRPVPLGVEVLIRLSSYILIAVIISSFRRSFNRERFMARRDLMTGAMNKAAFERHAEKLLRTACAAGRTMLLATIDLDDFKALNDQQGHAAGDAALRAFAAGAAGVLRRQVT